MKVLHYSGEGRGFMSGVKDYIVILDDDADIEEQKAPGFELISNTLINDLPSSFPVNTNLVVEK